MAQTKVVNVTVQELTKYGFKANDRYVGWSKNLDESAKIPVVPGRTFSMELYIADSGKEYVNKILKQLDSLSTGDHPKTKKHTPKTDSLTVATGVVKTTEDKPMLRADWEAKDRRISRQGCIQAAVQAVSGLAGNQSDLFYMAEALANNMLEFVNK